MTDKNHVSREELYSLVSNRMGDFSTNDLGWWLETKTNNKFTIIEREFILQALNTLDKLNANTDATVQSFKKDWLAKLDTLLRNRDYKNPR